MTVAEHPAWCSPRFCGVTDPDLPAHGGEHRSGPRVLDAPDLFTNFGPIRPVSAFLTQSASPWATATYLHLESAGNDITLPLTQAAGPLAQLTALVEQATSDH